MVVLLLVATVLSAAGCSVTRKLMPTPNVLVGESQNWYADIAPELRSTSTALFYVTDRAAEQEQAGKFRFGYHRSPSLSFGTVEVALGVGMSWEALLRASNTQRRSERVPIAIRKVDEIVRTPDMPLPFKEIDGQIIEETHLAKQLEDAVADIRKSIERRLGLTARKEVFLYVHGYHSDFEDAAMTMAELWHFFGRIGVPIVYSWPAGYPGLFGYTYDRESSEFTVFHLRQTLKLLSSIPSLEKIHIIAHSRGSDVVADAVRELSLQARAAGIDPRRRYKIHNLVLAAADLDVEVTTQRMLGDRLGLSVNRLTIYASPEDRAIGMAAKLFASPRGRVGTLGIEDTTDHLQSALEYSRHNTAFINYSGSDGARRLIPDGLGHSYFRKSPTVSSDLILMLRNDIDPGVDGRPLKSIGLHFWQVPEDYP